MEIDRIQLQGAIRVERSGGEQQRRRRQENAQEFAEELEHAEESAAPETDHVETALQSPLPVSIDIVSIAGARNAVTAGGTYGVPRGAYGTPKLQPASPAPTESKPEPAEAAADTPESDKPAALEADDHTKSVDTLA